jgi:hypothetical protein
MIRLTDAELDIVLAAARPLDVRARDAFLQEVARPSTHKIASVVPEVQAIFRRRRHQPRRPPLAKIRPGRKFSPHGYIR